MKASHLFTMLEAEVPPGLAVKGDRVGFVGPGRPDEIDVERVLVMMDYLPSQDRRDLDEGDYDLLVLHHPPSRVPAMPAYVVHSNWDLLPGGACDALADCLDIEVVEGVLDTRTGLGRVGRFRNGPVPLDRCAAFVREKLGVDHLRIVNYAGDRRIERVGVVSGFGLSSDLIGAAMERGLDLYISGDLTHAGAMRAKNTGLVLIDATHHATEVPGLYRLGNSIARMGVEVHVLDTGVPWDALR